MVIPVHGTFRHLDDHAKLALECGVNETTIPVNGGVFQLAPGPLQKVGDVKSGYLVLDGNQIRPIESAAVKRREVLLTEGICLVSIVLDEAGNLVVPPTVTVEVCPWFPSQSSFSSRSDFNASLILIGCVCCRACTRIMLPQK
eukprot:m.299225 g.299225  ORF g.299225 m.299225 type:complete len:143 (-) comp55183_c1_seq2:399-827(-)